MELKAEVWDRVMAFATQLANEAQPEKYRESYEALKDYCESQGAAGYEHPFLWETLADFTEDDRAAIPLYLKALDKASWPDAHAYRASIRFALAERYRRTGEPERAREYDIAADDDARQIDDRQLRRRIGAFLRERE